VVLLVRLLTWQHLRLQEIATICRTLVGPRTDFVLEVCKLLFQLLPFKV
jgi:hypothetical protein